MLNFSKRTNRLNERRRAFLLFVTRIKCITFRLSLSKQVHVLVFTRLRLLIEWTAIKSSRLNIILYMNFFFFSCLYPQFKYMTFIYS